MIITIGKISNTNGLVDSILPVPVSPGPVILIPGPTIFITVKPPPHNASLAREKRAFLKIINGLRRTRVTTLKHAGKVYSIRFFFKPHQENLSSELVCH